MVKFIHRRDAHSQVINYCDFISIAKSNSSTIVTAENVLMCCFNRIRSHPLITHSFRWFKFHAGTILWWIWQTIDSDAHLQFFHWFNFIPRTHSAWMEVNFLLNPWSGKQNVNFNVHKNIKPISIKINCDLKR